MPASLHYVLDTKIQLAAHDDGVVLAGKLVEEVEGDGVDFVVDVEAEDDVSASYYDGKERSIYHLMYFRWSFMITSMKSSTVAIDCEQTRLHH